MTSQYRVQIYLTGVNRERARDLRDALGKIIKGAGKEFLKSIMRQAYAGERILVYQSNNDNDARSIAGWINASGGQSEVIGLTPPEDLF